MNIKNLIQESFSNKDVIVKNVAVQEKDLDGTPKRAVILGEKDDGRCLIAEVEIKKNSCDIGDFRYFKDFVSAIREYAKYKRKVA